MWLGWAGHLSPPGALCSHQCHLGQLKGQWHREIGSPLPPCQLVGWRRTLCWAVLMPSCCPLSGTSDTGRGARRGSQGALWRHMALMGTYFFHCQPSARRVPSSSWQPLREVFMGKVLNLQQMQGTGDGFASRSLGTAGLGSAAVWQGASRGPGSPIPAGRCLAAGQRCPAAGGPQSGTRTVSRQPAVS